MLIKDQKNSNQCSMEIVPKSFLSSTIIMYLISLLEILWSYLILKINTGSLRFANDFLLIRPGCSLVSAKKMPVLPLVIAFFSSE